MKSWIVYYGNDGRLTNYDETCEARNKALLEGCNYLLTIRFFDDSSYEVEEAFHEKEDALAVAERLIEYHSRVCWCSVYQMCGSELYGDGSKSAYHYQFCKWLADRLSNRRCWQCAK